MRRTTKRSVSFDAATTRLIERRGANFSLSLRRMVHGYHTLIAAAPETPRKYSTRTLARLWADVDEPSAKNLLAAALFHAYYPRLRYESTETLLLLFDRAMRYRAAK